MLSSVIKCERGITQHDTSEGQTNIWVPVSNIVPLKTGLLSFQERIVDFNL